MILHTYNRPHHKRKHHRHHHYHHHMHTVYVVQLYVYSSSILRLMCVVHPFGAIRMNKTDRVRVGERVTERERQAKIVIIIKEEDKSQNK